MGNVGVVGYWLLVGVRGRGEEEGSERRRLKVWIYRYVVQICMNLLPRYSLPMLIAQRRDLGHGGKNLPVPR